MGDNDSIQISGKAVAVVVVLLLLIVSTFGMFFINGKTSAKNNNNELVSARDDKYSNLSEKCRPPNGQDIDSWKEHLGHHAETRDCLKYFD